MILVAPLVMCAANRCRSVLQRIEPAAGWPEAAPLPGPAGEASAVARVGQRKCAESARRGALQCRRPVRGV